jgi:outer membrane biosynthesis protein TonB
MNAEQSPQSRSSISSASAVVDELVERGLGTRDQLSSHRRLGSAIEALHVASGWPATRIASVIGRRPIVGAQPPGPVLASRCISAIASIERRDKVADAAETAVPLSEMLAAHVAPAADVIPVRSVELVEQCVPSAECAAEADDSKLRVVAAAPPEIPRRHLSRGPTALTPSVDVSRLTALCGAAAAIVLLFVVIAIGARHTTQSADVAPPRSPVPSAQPTTPPAERNETIDRKPAPAVAPTGLETPEPSTPEVSPTAAEIAVPPAQEVAEQPVVDTPAEAPDAAEAPPSPSATPAAFTTPPQTQPLVPASPSPPQSTTAEIHDVEALDRADLARDRYDQFLDEVEMREPGEPLDLAEI